MTALTCRGPFTPYDPYEERDTDDLAALNDQLRQAASAPETPSGSEIVRVVCECGDPECAEVIPVTAARFDRLRAGGRPVLAYHHARRRAVELAAESAEAQRKAEALLAEALATGERHRAVWQKAKEEQLPFDLEGAHVARLASVDHAIAVLEAAVMELRVRHEMEIGSILGRVMSALGLAGGEAR